MALADRVGERPDWRVVQRAFGLLLLAGLPLRALSDLIGSAREAGWSGFFRNLDDSLFALATFGWIVWVLFRERREADAEREAQEQRHARDGFFGTLNFFGGLAVVVGAAAAYSGNPLMPGTFVPFGLCLLVLAFVLRRLNPQ